MRGVSDEASGCSGVNCGNDSSREGSRCRRNGDGITVRNCRFRIVSGQAAAHNAPFRSVVGGNSGRHSSGRANGSAEFSVCRDRFCPRSQAASIGRAPGSS